MTPYTRRMLMRLLGRTATLAMFVYAWYILSLIFTHHFTLADAIQLISGG
jgi:hypothetical protein